MNRQIIENSVEASREDLVQLLRNFTPQDLAYANELARRFTDAIFGRSVYVRGLIEISNICKNDCYYCGIRRSNAKLERYRLTRAEILDCCRRGYDWGMRTFVLQGGEDSYLSDDILSELIGAIKDAHPDCAITLSLGERSEDSYRLMLLAGADRYLLRQETADREHYARLHPSEMSWEKRVNCLRTLQKLGYQTGCGLMVGSPGQSMENIADDLIFMRQLRPAMVGLGPFIPQSDTPFAREPAGSVELTLLLLSLVRLMLPRVLLPSTTALNTLSHNGRIQGLKAGANVIMPNLSPPEVRSKYLLYNHKASIDDEASHIEQLSSQLQAANFNIVVDRGDYRAN